MLPPKIVRRLLMPLEFVLFALLAVLAVVALPIATLAAALALIPPRHRAQGRRRGRFRAARLLLFAIVYLVFELVALPLALLLWVASGFGWKLRGLRFQLVHYACLRRGLRILVRCAVRLFQLELRTDDISWSPLDDGKPGSENAMIVASRHAGPGDSLLLIETLMNRDHLRKPRMVAKDTLQLDPAVDVYLNRVPNRFVNPNPERGVNVEDGIAQLADGLTDTDALLIFPEGGNFTDRRRSRSIERLRGHGLEGMAAKAEAMATVLAPRPGGVLAAHDAAPEADMIFVAHTGTEYLSSVRDIWNGLAEPKTLELRWSFVPASEIPSDRDAFIDWLYDWWADIDRWITERTQPSGARQRAR